MFLHRAGRSGPLRRACLVLALAVIACRAHEEHRPRDAAPADAVPIDAPEPVADAAGKPAPVPTKLVASGDSTCAVMSDLTVRCWGGNAHGQLGDGTTADAAAPVRPEIRAVKDLQLADGTACALLDDASVACWGRIGWHGHAEDVLRPTGVLGVIGVRQIFVLAGRACARVANDSLVCWGNVDARGHFAPGPTNRAPTPVVGLDHVAAVHTDGALGDDGRLWSWAGDGVPKLVDVTGVEEIGDREGTVCGRLQNGRVMCAPSARCGPRRPAAAPAPSPAPAKPAATKPSKPGKPGKPSKLAATKAGKAAATKPGKPTAAKPGKSPPPASSGTATASSTGAPPGEPPDTLVAPAARQLAFDLGFCVVTMTGKLVCGDGCRQVDPPKLERVDAVVGRCALLTSGTITCFDGGKPTAVPGITRASGLAVGVSHACAIVDTRILCWGSDSHHQLGGFAITP